MQIMEGDIIRTIQQDHAHFAHYHTAGNPGRGPLDAHQELYYPGDLRCHRSDGLHGFCRSRIHAQGGNRSAEGAGRGIRGTLTDAPKIPRNGPAATSLPGRYAFNIRHGRALVVGADDDAVRAHEILHRRPFLQEFRIGDHAERDLSPPLAELFFDFFADSVGRAHRNRGFVDAGRKGWRRWWMMMMMMR